MRDTLEAFMAVLVTTLIIGIVLVSLFAGVLIVCNHIYAGTVVEYEGTVQAVTKSSFLAPHTEVVLRTYSEDDVHFTLYGYHDFDIGVQSKISMTMRPYLYGLVCWGQKMEGEG